MSYLALPFLIFCFIWFSVSFSDSLSPTPLNGQHLRVIWPRWNGNPKGLSGPLKGGVVLDYLSARFNFTYEMVRVTENWLEPRANGRGLFSYLWDRQCDLLLQDVLPTFRRHEIVDMTLPWNYDYFAFLIPAPDETANIDSIIKPFQWPVWLGIIISMVCVIAVMSLTQRYLEFRSQNKRGSQEIPKQWLGSQYLYVFGNLMSQGGPCTSKRLPYLLIATSWTLAAFIFVQAYNSLLFSYVIAPVHQPLINSVYDIAESSDINLLAKKSGTIDTLLSNVNNTGLYKKLGKRLDALPNSRCPLVSECIQLITPGSRNVFIDAAIYHLDSIKADFEKTGKCNLQLAKNYFYNVIPTFALRKNSPYTQSISQGLLELQEMGLIKYWDLWFRPMPRQCMETIKSGYTTPTNKHTHLSLKNLTGAFIVLLVGFFLSLLAFLCEQIVSIPERHRRRRSKLQQMPQQVTKGSPNTADEEENEATSL
ncbi:ionotropic receptor 93a-like [Daphnia pulex]|uniref:ionotropic receptor 93a-like n=1 Tax=Daphnia pulex TaxID=6669 RepID=UPI001EE112E5|nr:ionotropic receptor 93a-like [Daphnia pulex]